MSELNGPIFMKIIRGNIAEYNEKGARVGKVGVKMPLLCYYDM